MSNLDLGTVLEFIKYTCWPFVALAALFVLIIYRAPLGKLISKLRKGEIHRDKDKGISVKVETDTEPDREVSREALPEQELEKTVRDSSEQEGKDVSPEAERIPRWADLMFNQEYKKAREEILSTIETEEPEKVEYLRVWAAHFLSKYSFNEAVEEFKELIKVYPENSFLYRLFAMAYAHNGLYEDAIAVLDNYPDDLPDLPSLRLIKAQLLKESGNPEKALDTAEELMKLEDDPQVVARCHLLRGKIFHSQDKADEARRAYLSAYAKNPTGVDVIEKIAEYFQEIGGHETELYFRLQLVNLDSKSVAHWGYLGNTYVALNFYNLALDAYEKANELSNGSQAWILANTGNLYNNVGLFSKATEMLQRASAMIDSYEYAHNRLAQAISNSQKQRKSADQIIEATRTSITRMPEESSSA